MSASSPAKSVSRPHLAAALSVLSCLLVAAIGGSWWGERAERKAFVPLLPLLADPIKHSGVDESRAAYLEHLKNQGTSLQREAFERPDILPLYGSSELTKNIPVKSSLFFRGFPTGFAVFPVGKVGTTPLIILQKLAAVGAAAPGRPVAISVSPTWFFTDTPAEHPYRGNFSKQQALGALLNPRLGFSFKRDLARRLLAHPETLEHDALLRFLTAACARGGDSGRALFAAARPLAELQQALQDAQDHLSLGFFVLLHPPDAARPPAPAAAPDWERLLAEADAIPASDAASVYRAYFKKFGSDEGFRAKVAQAPEWDDFELLLRGLHRLGLHPLILCMPPDGVFLENGGISRDSLALFSARIRALCHTYGAEVETFEDHVQDPAFFADPHDHLSAKGWMYYNRALDRFYHGEGAARHVSTPRHKRPHLAA
ncbi:MAG TPA: D-alanyl-lipoteichoic acid biosynthesis protein DltD [Chthoniobacteraceae bacterium]|jgi:D-alanine transfer protein|nr:D-alanyl-lipoteichoic acid biosynthesis protein DltD [Chthoniobacteraceae bacterium]